MLTISKTQLEVFAQYALGQFENRMLEHMRRYFPGHVALLDEAGLRATIGFARQRAADHGMTSQREVCYFLNLMLMLGGGFADDPQLPWIQQYLADDAAQGRPDRMDRLYGKTVEYLEQVAGEGNAFVLAALERVSRLSLASLDPGATASAEFSLRLFRYLHPEKARGVGEANLRRLLEEARHVAPRLGLGSPVGTIVCGLMMYFLGHRFYEDPQLPWVQAALRKPSAADSGSPAERLVGAAQAIIPRWLNAAGGN